MSLSIQLSGLLDKGGHFMTVIVVISVSKIYHKFTGFKKIQQDRRPGNDMGNLQIHWEAKRPVIMVRILPECILVIFQNYSFNINSRFCASHPTAGCLL